MDCVSCQLSYKKTLAYGEMLRYTHNNVILEYEFLKGQIYARMKYKLLKIQQQIGNENFYQH